jgi:antitoxin MazE
MSPEISISRWGNSQGLRIPKSIIDTLQINIGDKVKMFIENNRVIIEPVKKKKIFTIDELVASIPSDYKKEKEQFLEPMGKEIW